jgi:rhodanese-related sulfurtransferase
MRSKGACSILKGQQFEQLHNLQGGLDAWLDAKLPLIKT